MIGSNRNIVFQHVLSFQRVLDPGNNRNSFTFEPGELKRDAFRFNRYQLYVRVQLGADAVFISDVFIVYSSRSFLSSNELTLSTIGKKEVLML